MKTKKILATVALSAILLTGCSFNQGKTIVKVNGRAITQSQFDEEFNKAAGNSMFAQMGMNVKDDKNGFLYLMIKDRVVNDLIVRTLLDEEVEKRNITVTKEDTENELKHLIEKVGSKEKFDEVLKQNGITAAQFKKDLVEEVKIRKLIDMISKVNISDADAKAFYKENKAKFSNPEKVRASHILISANPEEIAQKLATVPANKGLSKEDIQAQVDKELAARLEKANKILAEVKKDPTSFEKVARTESDDKGSGKQGGDLGFFAKQDVVEPFSKAAFALKPNTISGIVKSPYGYHIILVKDRMAAGQEPFEKVKNQIKVYLDNQAKVKVLDNLIESMKKQAKIEYVDPEYNPKAIQEALKKQAKNNPAANEEMNPAGQSATPAPQTKK